MIEKRSPLLHDHGTVNVQRDFFYQLKIDAQSLKLQNESLRREIHDLEEAQRWRKVCEEKPKNGDVVLVRFSERTKGHYFPMDVVRWDSSYELGEIEVTHWMPLPKAPDEN